MTPSRTRPENRTGHTVNGVLPASGENRSAHHSESPPPSVHDAERLMSRRLLARLIDLAVCIALIHGVWYLLWIYLRWLDSQFVDWERLSVVFAAIFFSLLIVWLCLTLPMVYDILCIAVWGETVGKHTTGIKVVRHDNGRRLGLFRVIGRGLLPWLVGVPVFVAISVTAIISRIEIAQLMPIDRFDEVFEEVVYLFFYGAFHISFANDSGSMWQALPYQLLAVLCYMVPPLVGYLPVLWSRSGRAWYDCMTGAIVVKACEASDHPASPSWLMFRLLLVGPISLVVSLVVSLVLSQGAWFLVGII